VRRVFFLLNIIAPDLPSELLSSMWRCQIQNRGFGIERKHRVAKVLMVRNSGVPPRRYGNTFQTVAEPDVVFGMLAVYGARVLPPGRSRYKNRGGAS